MKIDPERCISCLECIEYCPMNSILEKDRAVFIDQDECVECGVCLRAEVCPAEAIYMPEESKEFPRYIRALFSNPNIKWPSRPTIAAGTGGRGTQEMKTNDVTGRYKRGEFGIGIEFGRPGIGSKISEIETVARVLAAKGVVFEEENPITHTLMKNSHTGEIKSEFKKEKILSGILEFKIRESQLEEIISLLVPVLEQVDTVVSVGLVTRFENDGSLPVLKRLTKMRLSPRPNAKINLGLGRPLID
ncbi:MAG: ferredoxin family protein [Thermodesulfobacteriota bacterium]